MKARPLITVGAAALAAVLAFGSGTASAHGPAHPSAARYGAAPHYGAPHYGAPHHAAPYPATPRIDQRQARQRHRIIQGVRSGELTRHEARRLVQQQRAIRHMERRAKADGIVTPWERRELIRAQNRASRSIYHHKHDWQHY